MFLLGAALALGFVVGTREVSHALVDMRKDPNVRVKGTAQRDVRAALGSWRGSITVRGPTLEEAYAALTAASERTREFVLEQGFAAGEIRLSAVVSNATYVRDVRGNETTEVESWRMRRSIQVDSANVTGIESLSLAATDLVGEGLEIESSAPNYVLATSTR